MGLVRLSKVDQLIKMPCFLYKYIFRTKNKQSEPISTSRSTLTDPSIQ